MSKRCSKKKRTNKQKKIVVLLGAGAAFPWSGITSHDIKRIFIEDNTYTTVDGSSIGRYIFEILNEFYGSDSSNFETFIAVLETIQNHILNDTSEGGISIYNTSYTPAILQLQNAIDEIFTDMDDYQRRQHCYALYIHYINLLIREIEAYNNTINNEENNQHNKHLLDLTKFFRFHGYSVKFYTTNYDNLIPQVLNKHFKLNEGLSYLSALDQIFNYNLKDFCNAQISHFNLHGSIFLQQKMVGSCYETVYNSYSEQLTNALLLDDGNPAEPLIFSPIITGYTKTQRIVNKPFSFGFTAFINDLNSCDSVLTIGYSFSDPHINSMISLFTNWKNVSFCHVTYFEGDSDTSSNPEYSRLDNTATPFLIKNENETWAHDSSEKKHIYKKGLNSFLQNKEAWKVLTKHNEIKAYK